MADHLIGHLQENINVMIEAVNQVQLTPSGFIQVQLMARSEFDDFYGHDSEQLPDETFDYIEAYRFLNQRVTGAQQVIQQHWPIVFYILNLNSTNPGLFENQEVHNQYYRLTRWIHNGIEQIEAQRNKTRRFLLLGRYANQQQLEQGFNGVIPGRFRYRNVELFGLPMVNNSLNWIQMVLNPNQVPQPQQGPPQPHVPTAQQFTVLLDMAEGWLDICQAIVDEQQEDHGHLNLEEYELLVPGNAFDYINFFRQRNDQLREHEETIEDQLELIERIAEQMPEVLNEQQQQLFQDLSEQFHQLQQTRDNVRALMLNEGLASEDQLEFGYDGVMPDAFLDVEGVDLW